MVILLKTLSSHQIDYADRFLPLLVKLVQRLTKEHLSGIRGNRSLADEYQVKHPSASPTPAKAPVVSPNPAKKPAVTATPQQPGPHPAHGAISHASHFLRNLEFFQLMRL